MAGSSSTWVSRIPAVAAAAAVELSAIVDDTAQSIAEEARSRSVSRRVSDSITVSEDGRLTRVVGAGDRGTGSKAFFAHIIEFGSVRVGARPFMTPAAEAVSPEFEARVRRVYR